jgi:hypothetical protein
MSRRPQSARARRRELRKAIEIAADIADRRLRQALEEGLIGVDELPEGVAQRIKDALQPPLEGHIADGEVVVDPPASPLRRRQRGRRR